MNKKRVLSICMVFCLIAGVVFGTSAEVSAKASKGIKISINGKSVTFGNSKEPKTLKEVEKKWGKKTRLAKGDEEYAGYAYVWKKGKSKVIIRQPSLEGIEGIGKRKYLGYMYCDIKDKNISVADVKVGMKRASAVKKLKAIYGSKNVKQQKKGKAYTQISVDANTEGCGVFFYLKNDRVSRIEWMRS